MAGLPGYGEGPFSICSEPDPIAKGIEFCIRAVGNLTNAMHRLKKGDTLWVRGPFGRGFSVSEFSGKDIVFVAGGIGIVPMRSLIKAVISLGNADKGGITLICGAKTPEELLFAGEMEEWVRKGVDLRLTIDKPSPGWKGNVGVVTTMLQGLKLRPERTMAVIIGPPVMYKFVILGLREKGIPYENMLVSLERRMKCGVGKCGHCQIQSVYCCQEGPVFRLSELKGLSEAI
jgi:NAD(P)H-flavin reductase